MILRAVIVFALLAALVVPIVVAEVRRVRRPVRAPKPVSPRPASGAATPLRLVVDHDDMDRQLADLLAKDGRKSTHSDD